MKSIISLMLLISVTAFAKSKSYKAEDKVFKCLRKTMRKKKFLVNRRMDLIQVVYDLKNTKQDLKKLTEVLERCEELRDDFKKEGERIVGWKISDFLYDDNNNRSKEEHQALDVLDNLLGLYAGCDLKGVTVSAGAGLATGAGIHGGICVTDSGKRRIYLAPSVSVGIGVGASVTAGEMGFYKGVLPLLSGFDSGGIGHGFYEREDGFNSYHVDEKGIGIGIEWQYNIALRLWLPIGNNFDGLRKILKMRVTEPRIINGVEVKG